MKKIIAALFLTSVLSLSVFADGDLPTGNKNCPQGQQCLVGETGQTEKTVKGTTNDDVFSFVKTWLEKIFG